jgi:hypothetical protein
VGTKRAAGRRAARRSKFCANPIQWPGLQTLQGQTDYDHDSERSLRPAAGTTHRSGNACQTFRESGGKEGEEDRAGQGQGAEEQEG